MDEDEVRYESFTWVRNTKIENSMVPQWASLLRGNAKVEQHGSTVTSVRMYGFKLKGGEWFKEGFQKLLSLEWTFFQIQLIENSVCQNTKLKAQHQKNNRLFRRNNRLFIPVYKYQN